MTPKEKAKDLYLTFKHILNIINDMRASANPFAIHCAKQVVREIIASRQDDASFNVDPSKNFILHPMYLTYWNEVLKELDNL